MRIFKTLKQAITYLPVLVFVLLQIWDSMGNRAWAQFESFNSPFKSKIIAIQQDQQGFVWFASKATIARFDGYDFFQIDFDTFSSVNTLQFNDFIINDDNIMFIATKENGLLKYDISTLINIEIIEAITDSNIISLAANKNSKKTIWAAGETGVYTVTDSNVNRYPYQHEELKPIHFTALDEHRFLLTTLNQLYVFDRLTTQYQLISYDNKLNPTYIWDVLVVNSGVVLVSTDKAIHRSILDLEDWHILDSGSHHQSIVHTMATSGEDVWFGSSNNGLSYFDQGVKQTPTAELNEINSNLNKTDFSTLSSNQTGQLWIGHFDGGISLLNPKNLQWSYHHPPINQPKCQDIFQAINHISEDKDGQLWFVVNKKIIKFNPGKNSCEIIEQPKFAKELVDSHFPVMTFKDNKGHQWAYYYKYGLVKYNQDEVNRVIEVFPIKTADNILYNLIEQSDAQNFLFESARGVVNYNLNLQLLTTIGTNLVATENAFINNSAAHPTGGSLLATSKGLLYLNDSKIQVFNEIQSQLPTEKINDVHIDHNNHYWVGTKDYGLFLFDEFHQLMKWYYMGQSHPAMNSISSITEDLNHLIWIATDEGLYQLETESNKFSHFTTANGLPSNVFSKHAQLYSTKGIIYLGTNKGLVTFDPTHISTNSFSAEVFITQIQRFNEIVRPTTNYDGFRINRAANFLEKITLSYKDYIIGFEFAALNFTQSNSTEYAYQMVGFDPEWRYTSFESRKATYTNLPSGQYTLEVKAADKGGQWSSVVKKLSIKVLPPPWLTWWALTSYVLLALGVIYWYIQHKVKTNQRIAAMLRVEVNEKTKELKIQKQTVESLLAKKNELFSNVSHEFRTPLTLILGPINELLNKQAELEDSKSLGMIKRNANRLLSLVEQLLQIARVSDSKKIKTTPQNAQIQLQSLIESFQHMAQSKNINLQLVQNVPATINVTDQFIDATMGNLVSNAIKYTQSGGSVFVSSKVTDGLLFMSVKDTGIGLTQDQQRDIFKRFKRLESHLLIEGIGIGLSVVEEVVKINDGIIKVDSELGLGSEFTVCIPQSDAKVVKESKSISTLVNQLQAESLEASYIPNAEQIYAEDSSLNTVLVIEDNHDMREHIISIVGSQYNCIAAENGIKGVAAAIEHIPDIIISDVMMPEMDGFKVARIIRSDQRTSHIPLMLLTALHDKANRIKGWRENVDAYMTKPFDRDELLVHLENMLTIRDILKTKAGDLVKQGQSITAALPKKDKEFIEKLQEAIQLNYQDPILNRAKIASKMAVSDRQLQRKTKALIDQNPMDLLREFRLNKAKELLMDGYQVSQVSDHCGFNSLSYFSQCFKAQFGMSPKKYQQTT